MQSEDDRMITDDGAQTQQQTQSTQQASQIDYTDNTHLWGYLIPCSANLRRIDFQKIKPSYSIGRNREGTKNDIIFPGMKISESPRSSARLDAFRGQVSRLLTRLSRSRQLPLCH